jgi:hypothetical protein
LLAVLVEGLYELANQLEDILVESTQSVVGSFFQGLIDRVRKSDYYKQLYRLLGNDGGLEANLQVIKREVTIALVSAAKIECDRFVRESPRFYDEGTFSIYQFRQTLLQTAQGYDCSSMVDAEPAIRQLLKLDFEPKVSNTIRRTFRQTINQTMKTQLLPIGDKQADEIMQQYNKARAYLEQSLEKEAAEKIEANERLQMLVEAKIEEFNKAVSGINNCLSAMQLYECQLPVIAASDLLVVGEDFGEFDVEESEEVVEV